MKILVVHNRYQHRGGEDAVVEAEIALLHQYGHEVQTYYRDNDEIPGLSASEVAAYVCSQFGATPGLPEQLRAPFVALQSSEPSGQSSR